MKRATRLANKLTGREREIARLVAKGRSNREIAWELDITEGTVKMHVHNMLVRLGMVSRIRMVQAFHGSRSL